MEELINRVWAHVGLKTKKLVLKDDVEEKREIYIRELSGADREDYDAVPKDRAKEVVVFLLCRSLCTPSGTAYMDQAAAEDLWQRAGWSGLDRLLQEIFALNGLDMKSQAEIRGNSESGKIGNSGSTLPQPSE